MVSMTGQKPKTQERAIVSAIEPLSERTHLVRLQGPRSFSFEPGQYVALVRSDGRGQVSDNGGAHASGRHYFSCASESHPEVRGRFELCMKKSASFARDLALGEEVGLDGPLGPKIAKRAESQLALLVATGTGVAPLRSSLRSGLWSERKVVVIVGQRTRADLLFDDEFRAEPELDYRPVLSQPGAEGTLGGRVQVEVLRALGSQATVAERIDAVVCGQSAMVSEVVNLLREYGVPEEGIFAQGYA